MCIYVVCVCVCMGVTVCVYYKLVSMHKHPYMYSINKLVIQGDYPVQGPGVTLFLITIIIFVYYAVLATPVCACCVYSMFLVNLS